VAVAGKQIFVDGQPTAKINSDGQAKTSSLSPGPHRLRLSLNAYRDYDQAFEVAAGQTITVTANLELWEPIAFLQPANPTGLRLAEAILSKAVDIAVPKFVQDRTLTGHSGWVTAVAFSPDGKRLASGSWDQTVKFWDVRTGRELANFSDDHKGIQAIAYSRDGRWLAAERSDNAVVLRDAATGREIRVLPGNSPGGNWIYSIAFSPDTRGSCVASGSEDGTIKLWKLKSSLPN
jgi:WD40 repeat protein